MPPPAISPEMSGRRARRAARRADPARPIPSSPVGGSNTPDSLTPPAGPVPTPPAITTSPGVGGPIEVPAPPTDQGSSQPRRPHRKTAGPRQVRLEAPALWVAGIGFWAAVWYLLGEEFFAAGQLLLLGGVVLFLVVAVPWLVISHFWRSAAIRQRAEAFLAEMVKFQARSRRHDQPAKEDPPPSAGPGQ